MTDGPIPINLTSNAKWTDAILPQTYRVSLASVLASSSCRYLVFQYDKGAFTPNLTDAPGRFSA